MSALHEPLWVGQRCAILDALEAFGPVGYVHKNGVTATCWLCGGWLGVRFRPTTVDLICTEGCDEDDLAATLFEGVA